MGLASPPMTEFSMSKVYAYIGDKNKHPGEREKSVVRTGSVTNKNISSVQSATSSNAKRRKVKPVPWKYIPP